MPLYKATITTTTYFMTDSNDPNKLLLDAERYLKAEVREHGFNDEPEVEIVTGPQPFAPGFNGSSHVWGGRGGKSVSLSVAMMNEGAKPKEKLLKGAVTSIRRVR